MNDHIAFLEDAVQRTGQEHSRLQAALSETQAALEGARRAVAAHAADEATLLSSLQALASDLALRREALEKARSEARAGRVRNLLAHFPYDLFRAIFLHAVECDDIWAVDDGMHVIWWPPSDRQRVPIQLAAVNRQWRNIALDTAGLWSLVAVRGDDRSNHARILEYVETLLRRSKTHDLDVIIAWESEYSREQELLSYFQKVMDAASCHAHRWRRVSIGLPDALPEDASWFLLLPMPRLDQLRLFCRQSRPSLSGELLPSYLPMCPRLRCLYVRFYLAPPQRQLLQLINLEISVGRTPPDVVWATLRMLPALEILQINILEGFIEGDATGSGPVGRLSLARLRRAVLEGFVERFSPWLSALDMPRLQELEVDITPCFFSTLGRTLSNAAASVTTLAIRDTVAFQPHVAACMAEVRKLRELRRIVFGACMNFSQELGAALASRETAGLPKLECVAFEYPALSPKDEMILSDLMHTLHSNPAGGVTFSLTTRTDGKDADSDWLLQQYNYLTGTDATDDAI